MTERFDLWLIRPERKGRWISTGSEGKIQKTSCGNLALKSRPLSADEVRVSAANKEFNWKCQ